MAKKKSKKPAKAELSKKERKALEAREAELAAELKRREKKAAKKGGKKKPPVEIAALDVAGGTIESGITLPDAGALGDLTIGAEAPIPPEPAQPEAPAESFTPDEIIAAADKVLADPGAPEVVKEKAAKKKRQAEKDLESDADVKARVTAKKEARKLGRDAVAKLAETIDRADADAVRRYNVMAAEVGVTMLTSDAEKERIAARLEAERTGEAPAQATEAVETETGRIFETGESVAAAEAPRFAKPSDAEPVLESGSRGYKIIQLDAEGNPDPRKVRQMTRVTTFVGNIDDETSLKKWEKRLLAEGLSGAAEDFVPRVLDIAHRRDVKIAKAEKADRKGKLGVGEIGRIVKAAEKEARDALDALVDEALEAAGRNEKADAGTALHELAELRDDKGIDAVRELREKDEITETQLAAIEAYDYRMIRLGAKVMHAEAVVVNDDMGYAGRLDRILMAKLPEIVVKSPDGEWTRPADQRARRYVADIKSGSLEFGAGKIARQMAGYALGDLYDPETGKRSRHSAARDIGLVFHLPQGEGVCHVYAVDLRAGVALLKLSAEVRRARNTGRKVITFTDIIDGGKIEEGEGE